MTVARKDLARIAQLSYVAAIHIDGVVHAMSTPLPNITKIKADQWSFKFESMCSRSSSRAS